MTTSTGYDVRLRPATDADRALLLAVYAASRADELDRVAWPPGQRDAFVAMQFDLQDRQYRATHPEGDLSVVEVDGHVAGRLYLSRTAGEIRVVDIALLPGARSRGIGTALLRAVQAEAASSGCVVSLHVEADHRARGLYERLGFRAAADLGVRRLLVWRSDPPNPASPGERR